MCIHVGTVFQLYKKKKMLSKSTCTQKPTFTSLSLLVVAFYSLGSLKWIMITKTSTKFDKDYYHAVFNIAVKKKFQEKDKKATILQIWKDLTEIVCDNLLRWSFC